MLTHRNWEGWVGKGDWSEGDVMRLYKGTDEEGSVLLGDVADFVRDVGLRKWIFGLEGCGGLDGRNEV